MGKNGQKGAKMGKMGKKGQKGPKVNNISKFLLPGVFCHICNYIAERVVYGGHQGHIHLKDFVFLLV